MSMLGAALIWMTRYSDMLWASCGRVVGGAGCRHPNFLGFPPGISGSELAIRAYEQAWLRSRTRPALVKSSGVAT
jgi:hypothetical protein